jgi:hypothetical protein
MDVKTGWVQVKAEKMSLAEKHRDGDGEDDDNNDEDVNLCRTGGKTPWIGYCLMSLSSSAQALIVFEHSRNISVKSRHCTVSDYKKS